MRIEDIKAGETYIHTCDGCHRPSEPDFCPVKIGKGKTLIKTFYQLNGKELVEHRRDDAKRSWGCPPSQFTPIEPAKEEKVTFKIGEKARIHFTLENPATTDAHTKWEGKIVTLASYVPSMRIWVIVEPAPGTNGCTLCFRDSWLEKTEPAATVETFPGGFTVGDRIRLIAPTYTEGWRGALATVVPAAEVPGHPGGGDVPFRLDIPREWCGKTCSLAWGKHEDLQHLKESEPARVEGQCVVGFNAAPKSEAPKPVPDDGGEECKEHDWETSRYPMPPVKVLCILCGQAVPAKHEKAHRQSMECVQARHKDEPAAKLDTWKCHCGAVGRYIELEKPFTDCPSCGGEVQDS